MTHKHLSEVPSDEVRQAIHFTADRVSNSFGLDVERVRGVLERTKYLGPNEELSGTVSHSCTQQDSGRQPAELYSYIFSPSLTEALGYLEPEKALSFFETKDLDLLRNRESAFKYLTRGSAQLYSIDELEHLTRLFLSHLKRNRDHLLKTGLPNTLFAESKVWDVFLSPLYYVKQPISINIKKSNDSKSFVYDYIYGKENKNGTIKRCQFETAPLLKILTQEDSEYLNEIRPRLFELKYKTFQELVLALQTNNLEEFYKRYIELLKATLTKFELASLIRIDKAYIESGIHLGGDLLNSHRPVTGGITDLFEIIGHFEKELTIATYSKTRKALESIITFDDLSHPPLDGGKENSPYFKYVSLGKKNPLDKALDLFLALKREEESFWEEYRQRVRKMLEGIWLEPIFYADSSYIRYRVEEIREGESSKVVIFETTVAGEHAYDFGLQLEYFAEYFKRHIEAFGQVPKPPPFHLTDTAAALGNVFRKEEEIWRITFQGETISLRDSKGLRYIAFLIEHAGEPFHVLDLIIESEGISPDIAERGRSIINHGPLRDFEIEQQHLSQTDHESKSSSRKHFDKIQDSKSIRKYKARLKELQQELAEAERNYDEFMVERLRKEKEDIEEQLCKTRGLGGKYREFSDDGEKARKSVQAAISRSLRKIQKEYLDLGAHLDRTIDTGFYCVYKPLNDIEWS